MFDHFDFLASIYDRFIGIQEHQKLIELLELPISGKLLDAGGGTGRVSHQIHSLVEKVLICDPSFKMLKQAKNKGGLFPIKSHVEKLPFPDESFERIIVIDSFHHFCDQNESVKDLIRVLKPGGRLVIEEPDINHFAVKMVAIAEKLFFMRSTFYSPKQIQDIFFSNGISANIEHDGKFTAWIIVDK